ncbi:BTB/POZ fold domain-containing protein [Cordyceps javanica]|uniref:BTB/POZ fold domain-containing protein n=1 Tax=Cordyceps javanica TaxID=43265 RepID=A0A545VFK5_9HYPO|nr:BTB/POZ fold domain-containing protein [Cordyceps javanica]TQW11697.1 BTB/POZ fold domain containing protein [Cordyceps javanica]
MLMIQYLYTGKHTHSPAGPVFLHESPAAISETRNFDNPDYVRRKNAYVVILSVLIRLLDLAETYLIDGLVAQVISEFRAVLCKPKHGYCFMAVLELIPQVYAVHSASRNLLRRECVAAAVAGFGPWLTAHGTHRQALDNVLLAVPQFAKDLLEGFIVVEQNPVQKQGAAAE